MLTLEKVTFLLADLPDMQQICWMRLNILTPVVGMILLVMAHCIKQSE